MADQTANQTNSGTDQSTATFPGKENAGTTETQQSTERDIAITKTENTVHEPEHPGVKPSQPPQEQQPENASRPEDAGNLEAKGKEFQKLEVPKDTLVPPGIVERIESYAKEKKLSQPEAQALFNREHQARSEYKTMVDGWKKQVLDDPEIGGVNAARNIETASRVWRRFADQDMVREAEESGLADHPGMVKFMVRVGKLLSEDQFVNSSAATPASKDPVEIFYGKKSS